MRRVVVVSPLSGDVEASLAYLDRCGADCVRRGESPIAGHAWLPRFLDDADPQERAAGIAAGHAWLRQGVCDAAVVYLDRGLSRGMREDIEVAAAMRVRVELRFLDGRCPKAFAEAMTVVASHATGGVTVEVGDA